jgi:hypothetical protein
VKNLTTRKGGISDERTSKKRIYQNIEKKETENSGAVKEKAMGRAEAPDVHGEKHPL